MKFSARHFRSNFNLFARISAFALLCFLMSCTNNLFSGFGGRQNLSTNSGFGPQENFFTLTTVVESNAVPGAIEFIGNGSAEFGEFCLSANQQAPTNEGPSDCECQFDYDNNGNQEQVRTETIYHEDDMIRCDNPVPSGITNVEASVFLKTAAVNSNKVATTLPDLGNSLDLTDPQSYDKIEHLQCRDVIFIPQLFAALFYDPIQSESPLLSYPLHYFTNSVARSILTLYNNSASGQGAQTFSKFECATDPNKLPFWYNPYIYSEQPDTAGKYTIFPPNGSSFDRSTFYLARKSSGSYNVPINVAFSPLTVGGTGEFEPIGFGAKPRGTNEVCPTVELPAGWEQVKVYAFRASLEAREFVASFSSNTTKNVQGIYCDPGKFPDGQQAILECVNDPTSRGATNSTNATTSLGNEYFAPNASRVPVVDRVFAVDGSGSGPVANDVCFERTGVAGLTPPGNEPVSPITDVWRRRWDGDVNQGNQETMANPPFNLNNFSVPAAGPVGQTDIAYAPSGDLTLGNLDNSTSRGEQYLVVTPTTITSAQLDPPSGAGLIYSPYRYRAASECNSENPETSCPAGTRIPFLYNNRDLATGEEGAFPICAVRPTSQ